MEYWKLGCRWGKKIEGKPLFFDVLINNQIVISYENGDFGKNNLVLLTDGFTPKGIAFTTSTRKPIQELKHLKEAFRDKQIPFEDGIFYYQAKIYPISAPNFSYDAQQGIIKIHQPDTVKAIRNAYRLLTSMEDLKEKENLLSYKKQIILQGPPGTGKTKLAKELAEAITGLNKEELNDSDQFEIIQFHPSYSYEDFVRGITAKPNPDGDGLLYEPENRLLADFAERALKNYNASLQGSEHKKTAPLETFLNEVIDQIDQSPDGKYSLTDNVYIYRVDEHRLKYKGDNWTAHPNGLNMHISELENILRFGLKERREISSDSRLKSPTRQHATYYTRFLEKMADFMANSQPKAMDHVTLKKYVLVIDEINRANLSIVFGELIYALEYRQEGIKGVYDHNLELPPNLFIIGTMNTADRSVSHIDYAIRRRFAFVSVLPKDLSEEMGADFDGDLFRKVARLFVQENGEPSDYLSREFEPKDVQLGHSYFIRKDNEGGTMKVRLQYEIRPILHEYVRDGILKETAKIFIEELQCSE